MTPDWLGVKLVVHQYICGALYFFVDLFPGAAVCLGSSDLGTNGGVFVRLGAFTTTVKAKSWDRRFGIDLCVEFTFLID